MHYFHIVKKWMEINGCMEWKYMEKKHMNLNVFYSYVMYT